MLDLSSLPFSSVPEEDSIETAGRRLLETLGLKGRIAVVEVDPVQGLAGEAFFRRRWWSGMPDAFRDALHAAKFQAHSAADKQQDVTHAWSEMRKRVASPEWRDWIRNLLLGRSALEACSIRIAFGAAAQTWTRAARWDAAFGEKGNPFAQMTRLFELFCWPWGIHDGTLHLGRLLCRRWAQDLVFEKLDCPIGTPNGSAMFLSAPFREPSSRAIAEQIQAKGWKVTHRQVDERIAPEPQLGADIRAAPVTVCAALNPDPDFGIPWWMFQELDFAIACARPVAMLGGNVMTPIYPELETFPVNRGIIDEGFWPWLESKMRY